MDHLARLKREVVLRSIVNQFSTMTDNTTYDMAISNVKTRTTNVIRGAHRYGVLEDSDDEECTIMKYKMSNLKM
jgi:hypothetical protein